MGASPNKKLYKWWFREMKTISTFLIRLTEADVFTLYQMCLIFEKLQGIASKIPVETVKLETCKYRTFITVFNWNLKLNWICKNWGKIQKGFMSLQWCTNHERFCCVTAFYLIETYIRYLFLPLILLLTMRHWYLV